MITVTNKLVAVLQKIKKSASLTMLLTALLCAGCTHQGSAHSSTAQSSTAQTLGDGGGGGNSAAGADPQATKAERPLNVVTTTGLLRDLVKNVAGDRANVTSIVPDGADPHSYEPTLRSVRDIVYADAAFSNYLLLEEHRVIETLDSNLKPGVPNVALAEAAVQYAAEIIPLVEDASVDTIWLGLRSSGADSDPALNRRSTTEIQVTEVTGPGRMVGYLTGSFGDIERYFDSADGFDKNSGYRDDTAVLPVDAHTHMSWAFTKPGLYRVKLQAKVRTAPDQKPRSVSAGELVFAVGVSPDEAVTAERTEILDSGHADITAQLDRSHPDSSKLTVVLDEHSGKVRTVPVERAIISVPSKAIHEVPGEQAYRFLGKPGQQIYQLPQAVLGKHVHGEIDPHLWQDVKNAMAYVQAIRDTLSEVDPGSAQEYHANAESYLAELEQLDNFVRETIAEVPAQRRTLVTTHDAFGYLANAYDMQISGFVAPNPAAEPSLSGRKKLTETLKNLEIPAVFLEPNLAQVSNTLSELAAEQHIKVCTIYGDSFSSEVNNYLAMMRFNATSIRDCLG